MNKEILKRTNKPINNKSNFPTFKSNKKNQHFNTKTPVLRKKKELTPYTFIKWKDRKTAQKFFRKGPLTVKKKKLEKLLNKLATLKNVDLLKKKLDKNVKLPIKRPGKIKIEIKEGKELELPIKKLDKNLVFLVYGWGRKRRMKRQLKLKYTYKKMSWRFLKFLIKFQDKNLVFPIEILERNLELLKEGKFLDLPIKRKTLIFQTGKREELIISRKDKNLVFLFKRKYKDSKFAVKRGTNDKIQEFPFNGNFLKFLIKFQDKDFVFPMENLERNIKFLINSLEQECSCRIVNMFRSIVFTRLQKSRYFDKLWKEEKKRNQFNWSLIFWRFFEQMKEKKTTTEDFHLVVDFKEESNLNFFLKFYQDLFKNLFLEDFLIFDNSYLISLKNKLLNKKKINDYQFFKFCYFLKIHLFSSILKGKILLSNVFLKSKPRFKFPPLFFNDKKFFKTVEKEKKFKSKNIIFKYRYNYSLSKVCNALRYIYYKKRWEEKIKTEKNPSFIIKNYGLIG